MYSRWEAARTGPSQGAEALALAQESCLYYLHVFDGLQQIGAVYLPEESDDSAARHAYVRLLVTMMMPASNKGELLPSRTYWCPSVKRNPF